MRPTPRFLPLLLLLFVGSGCAALIYEIVWLQLLQLVIGLTTISLGVLLGTFMGGMCLGSLLLPRLVSRRHHPLRVYALLELAIGLIGIAVLFVMPHVSRIYTANAGHGFTSMLVRCTVAAVCLLPPTLLMGATLPAISRWVEATPQGVSWLGFFYGGNIAGAVFGCLLAGFYLLRIHDMATATYVAAAINGAVAMVALGLAGRASCKSEIRNPKSEMEREQSLNPPLAPPGRGTDPQQAEVGCPPLEGPGVGSWPIYVAIGLSGLAALGAEVVWTRLLSLLLGGTVYTFSIILAVFLAGLGIGSSAGSLVARSTVNPRLALSFCQMLLAGGVAWTADMIAHSLPYWPIYPSLSKSPWFGFQLDMARCLWAILPAAILWGASFPLALASVASRGQDPGRLVGGVYAANTVGAILGALGFSMVVIPWIGTQWAQRLLIGLSAVAALFAFVPVLRSRRAEILRPERYEPEPTRSADFQSAVSQACRVRGAGDSDTRDSVAASADCRSAIRQVANLRYGLLRRFAGALSLAMAMGVAALLVWRVAPAPWGLTAHGRFMASYGSRLAPGITPEQKIPATQGDPDIFCTYLGEGLNGSVAVTQWATGARFFHSAGKVQASNGPQDMRLQRMLGHLAALAHSKPESVLVVACGAGVTAGTFVLHPEVKRIVICDIEPLVPRFVAPMFEKENYGVVKDPRTEVVFDDGRHFIRTTREKFDVITSDPIDPWVKGCAALNTVDYYEMCKAHLKPGGVMALWIPLYESNSETTKSVIATFFKAFPNGIIWSNDHAGEGYDAVLFGQVERTRIDLDQLRERLARSDHARVKQSLQEAGFQSELGLLATYAGQARDLQEWTRDAQINTDHNLRLQYLAGMWLNSNKSLEILDEITRYCRFPDELFIGSAERKQTLKLWIEGSGSGKASSSE